MKHNDIILQCFALVWAQDKVWEDMKPNEIIRILMYSHQRGWLYVVPKGERIVGFAIAYRTAETDGSKMPEVETGRILFCPIAVAKEGYGMYLMRKVKSWLKQNEVHYDELVFNKKDKVVRKKLEKSNGEKQRPVITSDAELLHEPQLTA